MGYLEHYIFGYDLAIIEQAQFHIEEHYEEDKDYIIHIGIGEDVMNAIDILSEAMLQDETLSQLINDCEGKGFWID
tara:strand:+ start:69 stop:296 length:228 start_codon:yes stop_codon:yes gene_type:complete